VTSRRWTTSAHHMGRGLPLGSLGWDAAKPGQPDQRSGVSSGNLPTLRSVPVERLVEPDRAVSVIRLRVGAVLLLIWFIPFWALAPWIAKTLGWSVHAGVELGVVMSICQTVIGIVGAFIAGKDATALVKGTRFKKVPGRVWRIIWTGNIEQ
jgi:uncharacterized membrane protein (DUF485 family)